MFGFTKTKLGIVIASAIFLALILLGELSPIGSFFPKNDITKEGIEKYQIQVLELPSLKRVASQKTSLNGVLALRQLGITNYFRVNDDYKNFSYFKLSKDWDFERLETLELQHLSKRLPPYYSLSMIEGTLTLLRLDQPFRSIGLSQDSVKSPKIIVFNNHQSAIMSWLNGKEAVLGLLKDISKSTLEYPEFKNPVARIIIDKYGTRAYATTFGDKESKAGKICYIDVQSDSKEAIELDTTISRESEVAYSAKANTICILDDSRLRILNANNGKVVKIIYLEDKKDALNERTTFFEILDNVPAAFLNQKLLDLRDGSVVDILPGFSKDTVYAIDYKNKNLYFTTSTGPDSSSKKIATYDLHNLRLTQEIELGNEKSSNKQSVKFLFLTKTNKLACLVSKAISD